MYFRIRRLDEDDINDHEAADACYRRHLDGFDQRRNTDLWTYFYWDFFHDGEISSLSLSPDFLTLDMHLNGPNIRCYEGDNFSYVSADFLIRFLGVRGVEITHSRDEETQDIWQANALGFHFAEINTHPSVMGAERADTGLSSLLIRCINYDAVWLEVLFAQVDVMALEPLAFALMQGDPRFRMPTYSPGA